MEKMSKLVACVVVNHTPHRHDGWGTENGILGGVFETGRGSEIGNMPVECVWSHAGKVACLAS